MDGDTASKFVASLVKSIQALCNGYIDFSSSIEVIGHIHLRIDENKKFNYVLSEEVSKSQNEAATVFSSHSYHSQPPQTTTTGRTAPSDSPSRNRRKTQQVPRVDESTLPPDVPSASKDSRYSDRLDSPASRRLSDGGDSRDTDTFPSVRKHEHNSGAGKQSTPSQDSFDRRRKLQPDSDTHSSRSQDPVPKKSRTGLSLSGSAAVQSSGFEVIEIKEEPADDESGDFFGDNNAAGQDISQPDFSNLVADSLDRVGQLEGTSLLAGGDAQQIPRQQLRGQQDQPFPIMLHANPTASTSSTVSYPGPSDQQGAVASSSGDFLTFDQGNQVSLDFMEDTYEEANDFEEDDDDLPIEIDIASLATSVPPSRVRLPKVKSSRTSAPSKPPKSKKGEKTKRRFYKQYAPGDLETAIQMVNSRQCTCAYAADKYNIPVSTLQKKAALVMRSSGQFRKRGRPKKRGQSGKSAIASSGGGKTFAPASRGGSRKARLTCDFRYM